MRRSDFLKMWRKLFTCNFVAMCRFADMRTILCNRLEDIVVRKWFLMSRRREKARSAEADVTGSANATSIM